MSNENKAILVANEQGGLLRIIYPDTDDHLSHDAEGQPGLIIKTQGGSTIIRGNATIVSLNPNFNGEGLKDIAKQD